MNERQPVDDLFARVLRDAEAEPPQAVWDGVVARRGARRRHLLLLRRRWGLLALLLVCCGVGAYELLSSNSAEGKANKAVPAITTTASPMDLAGTDLRTSEEAVGIATSGTEWTEAQARTRKTGATVSLEEATAVNKASTTTSSSRTRSSKVAEVHPNRNSRAASADSQGALPATISHVIGDMPNRDRGSGEASNAAAATAPNTATTLTPDVHNRSVERSPLRTEWGDRSLETPAPVGLSVPPSRRDRTRWWIGLDVGSYTETRKWHGGDPYLAQALNGTESRHPLLGAGLRAGMVQNKGWGLSIGVMYSLARSEYRHLDHVLAPMDSLVPYVVTFNDEVVANYTETVTVLGQAQTEVAVENRYSTVRIPVEGSWQHSLGRWKYRAAIGVAVECNTLRSGVTLEHGVDGSGLATVDARSANMKRTTVLATGSAAMDFGYALSEDWIIWAGPSYMTGLFPLSPADNHAFAMPERWGMQARLCYMLRTHE